MKPDRFHCPRCGYGRGKVERVCWDCRCRGERRTPSRKVAQVKGRGWLCDECGARFSGLTAFDMHRTGDFEHVGRVCTRRCRTPDEMTARGLVQNDGVWGQPRMPRAADGVDVA